MRGQDSGKHYSDCADEPLDTSWDMFYVYAVYDDILDDKALEKVMHRCKPGADLMP